MLEKMMNARKNIILLRSFFIVVLSFVMIISVVSPVSAASSAPNAAIVDYVDFIDSVSVENNLDIVNLKFPTEYCWVGVFDSLIGGFGNLKRIGNTITYTANPTSRYAPFFLPLGWQNTRRMSIVGIPSGTSFRFRYYLDVTSTIGDYAVGERRINTRVCYWDEAGNYLSEQITDAVGFVGDSLGYVSVTITDIPENAVSCSLQIEFWDVVPADGSGRITVTLDDFTLSMNISDMQLQNDLTLKQQALLKEVTNNQQVTNEKLESIKDLQQQTNDKLDGVQDSIDELPGEIGDEIQGVIDNEKAESESEGNKFVDLILDALPDPSTEVLGALKSLTDSTAYTGTDAVLPIPAIVLPGIAGLFPETEIWGGTDFDFGEYIQLLPSTLLTLVQALFTIAIVIFCVYELKGIISYCLTLRENKGG